MKFKIALLLLIFTFVLCSQKIDNGAEFPDWLIGTWNRDTGDKRISESWEFESDSSLKGLSWYITKDDSIITEKLRLLKRGGDLYYIADVPENPMSVYFKSVIIDENKYVFENPDHDFPKRIIYYIPENDTLRVRIEDDSRWKIFIFSR